jgi:hypothetical protein
MIRVLRSVAIAALMAAVLHATTGVCLCHTSSPTPASGRRPAGHACCHQPAPDDTRGVQAVPSCCHIEAAQRDMAPMKGVQLAPPPSVVQAVPVTLACACLPDVRAVALSPSPPIQALRL